MKGFVGCKQGGQQPVQSAVGIDRICSRQRVNVRSSVHVHMHLGWAQ